MKTILLVDDNRYLLAGLAMCLAVSLKDYAVRTAGNFGNAREIMNTVPLDFILMDLDMPFMDGYEAVAYARRRHPFIPVFVMAGYHSVTREKRVMSLGAARWIMKPFNFIDMADTISVELGTSTDALALCKPSFDNGSPISGGTKNELGKTGKGQSICG